MIVVIAGKGGVGKTTISSLLVRCIAEIKNTKILAIDADPASNFADALGVKALMSIADIIENFKSNEKINLDYLKQKISENTTYTEKFDFIEMGHGERQGCYCSINDALRFILEEKQKNYEFVIVDCAAGLEHLSRKTTTGADVLLIVTDPCESSFRSAETIKKIALNVGVKENNIFLVINKIKSNEILNKIANTKILEICRIPFDENVVKYNNLGIPLINLPEYSNAYLKIKELANFLLYEKILIKNLHGQK